MREYISRRSLGILYTVSRGGRRELIPVDVSTDRRTDGTALPLVILRNVVFYAELNHILEK